MFAKDPISMSYAQGALRCMAVVEPELVLPELLERAYGGLEVVNETHRTTAVMSMLSGIARPLVTENIWLGGQKHILPLLELCIPGIDLVGGRVAREICTLLIFVYLERPSQDSLCHDVYCNCGAAYQDRRPFPSRHDIFC